MGRAGGGCSETGSVARRERTTRKRHRSGRTQAGRRRFRLLWAVALLGAAVYLYYQPISSYVETRSELAARRAEVEALRAARAELEQRLASSTSVESVEREARRIGYVKPGERLFVVKGIPAWREAQRP